MQLALLIAGALGGVQHTTTSTAHKEVLVMRSPLTGQHLHKHIHAGSGVRFAVTSVTVTKRLLVNNQHQGSATTYGWVWW